MTGRQRREEIQYAAWRGGEMLNCNSGCRWPRSLRRGQRCWCNIRLRCFLTGLAGVDGGSCSFKATKLRPGGLATATQTEPAALGGDPAALSGHRQGRQRLLIGAKHRRVAHRPLRSRGQRAGDHAGSAVGACSRAALTPQPVDQAWEAAPAVSHERHIQYAEHSNSSRRPFSGPD